MLMMNASSSDGLLENSTKPLDEVAINEMLYAEHESTVPLSGSMIVKQPSLIEWILIYWVIAFVIEEARQVCT